MYSEASTLFHQLALHLPPGWSLHFLGRRPANARAGNQRPVNAEEDDAVSTDASWRGRRRKKEMEEREVKDVGSEEVPRSGRRRKTVKSERKTPLKEDAMENPDGRGGKPICVEDDSSAVRASSADNADDGGVKDVYSVADDDVVDRRTVNAFSVARDDVSGVAFAHSRLDVDRWSLTADRLLVLKLVPAPSNGWV